LKQTEFIQLLKQMPIYGVLRVHDPRLTFGQYLSVLKEWYLKVEEQLG